jgi:hypothetical protein
VCECCGRALPNGDPDARICSFECTFCATCAERLGPCPNCGGDLVLRPTRPAGALARHPAGARVVRAAHPGCAPG